jgi:hypothetical protein
MTRMKSIAFILCGLAGGIAIQPTARAEEYRGTMEQQMACTPDVWRLCGDQIPDVNRIVACLRANTPSLSDGCRAVFESTNGANQPTPRGRPPARPRPLPPAPSNDDDD